MVVAGGRDRRWKICGRADRMWSRLSLRMIAEITGMSGEWRSSETERKEGFHFQ